MNHTIKMLIPISLGVIAAFINFAVMSSSVQPISFVSVNLDVAVDKEFTKDMLERVKVPNEFKNLRNTAVPWEERGVLIGQKPSRNLYGGDVVLFQDIAMQGASLDLRDGETAFLVSVSSLSVPPGHMRIGGYVSFRLPKRFVDTEPSKENPTMEESIWVGPFRIVSIDGRLSNVIEHHNLGSRYVSEVTIAFPTSEALSKNQKMKKDLDLLQEFSDLQRSKTNVRMSGIKFHGDRRSKIRN